MITALADIEAKGIKLASCSFNSVPPFSFSSAFYHPALQAAFTQYNQSGGLLFNAVGNEHEKCKDPLRPNLVVIEAVDSTLNLAKFTNKGTSVWFAAPGVLVQCSDMFGFPVFISGTSFATPMTAGVAAMVMSAHPGETGNQILARMYNTSFKSFKKYKFQNYGYGIPDANAACQ